MSAEARQSRWSRLGSRLFRSVRALNALGVLAAVTLAISLNVLALRFTKSWDVTRAGLFTLSPATLETLDALSQPVDVIVFLSRSDPTLKSAERLLTEYARRAPLVAVRYVDPDRDPAEFMALQSKYQLSEGRTEQGRLVSDAAIIVAQGTGRWVIGADELNVYDENEGTVQPRLEQALTEGLRQVQKPTPAEVCFTRGQEELSIDDGGPAGLAAFRSELERNNYRVRSVDLLLGEAQPALAGCELVVVAGPRHAFAAAAAERLRRAVAEGAHLLVAMGPLVDEDGNITPSGLEPVLARFGLRFEPGLVFEQDPKFSVPVGLGGEAFFATPKPHALTQGLLRGLEPRYVVLLELAQGIAGRDGAGQPLLGTSERAFLTQSARALTRAGVRVADLERDAQGPFDVAMAAEAARDGGGDAAPARLVLLGSASVLWTRSFEDPALTGTRRFVESALSWLVTRPALVSLPPKPTRPVGLRLTEESLSQVARYVLVYMPLTALLIGGLSLYRRRHRPASAAPAGQREHG
jgi:gliding motility-associatede transport system auxiliary component